MTEQGNKIAAEFGVAEKQTQAEVRYLEEDGNLSMAYDLKKAFGLGDES